jgi:hypothetical protein
MNGIPDGTLIEHWDEGRWRAVPSPSSGIAPGLEGVSVASPTDVWAVGGLTLESGGCAPLIEHWDGVRWSRVRVPTKGGCLADVHVVSSDDVWAVGSGPLGLDGGTIWHWDGVRWSMAPDPEIGVLKAVSAPPAWRGERALA